MSPAVRRGVRAGAASAGLVLVDLVLFFQPDATGGPVPQYAVPVLTAVTFVPLLWRGSRPVTAFTGCLALSLLVTGITVGYRPMVAVWAALFAVAARRDLRTTAVAALATAAPAALLVVEETAQADPGEVGATVFLAIALIAVIDGFVVLAGRVQGAHGRRVRDLQRRQAALEREAAARERARIARELHDIVAHSISLMVLQAAGAAAVIHTDTARAERALMQVGDLGEAAVAELQRMLAFIDAADDGPPPQTLLLGTGTRIAEAVAAFRDAGLDVRLHVDGTARDLDPSVGQAAVRVVQEALTNASKHGAGEVSLALCWADRDLTIELRNAVAADPKLPGTGRGLAGLRERVRAAGGTLDTGTGPDGFRLRAVLPACDRSTAPLAATGRGEP